MFRNYASTLILIACFFSSCNQIHEDKERFVNAYLEIIIAREKFDDSVAANNEVALVYDKYGFTEVSFRDKYFEYAEKPEEFVKIVDSIRTLAKRKLDESMKNKGKKENKNIEVELE